MRLFICLIFVFLFLATTTGATVEPVTLNVPTPKAWVGQRLQFFVELRAPGSFDGTAHFSLPELPGTLIMKIGNPIVGSQEIDGESWMVQTHEFALFSQKQGELGIPAFDVRFSHKHGFTGPTTEVQAQVPGWKVQIQRPPDSDPAEYLITTKSFDITETWEPQPGLAQVGDIFKRSISQEAQQIPGMALMPPPTSAPEGVRIYISNSSLSDRLERGDFLGNRADTLTYLFTEPGTISLPAITYIWWNPVANTLQSRTLPSITVDVAAVPVPSRQANLSAINISWPVLLPILLIIVLTIWQRNRLTGSIRQKWKRLHPPERVAERNLLRACRKDNAMEAVKAWHSWIICQEQNFRPNPELRAEIIQLHKQTYGEDPVTPWQGDTLACIFKKHLAFVRRTRSPHADSCLPLLNPNVQIKDTA